MSLAVAQNKARSAAHYQVNREAYLVRNAAWREANAERKRQMDRDYYVRNRAERLAAVAAYKEADPERASNAVRSSWAKHGDRYRARRRDYVRERSASDPAFKLTAAIRNRCSGLLRRHFAGQKGKGGKGLAALGCTVAQLVLHIESQFQPGMTWDNWSRTGWHIDHRKALAKFDLTDPSQLAEACHYTNLQPMWAADNIRKGAS